MKDRFGHERGEDYKPDDFVRCVICANGSIANVPCYRCKGLGEVPAPETLKRPPVNPTRIQKVARRFFCDIMGWHNGNSNIIGFDGASVHAICKRCGKEIMQDSQGNWF